MSAPDPWSGLRRHTAARIALGRAGVSLPTAEWLRFSLAHALARDAVHLAFDSAGLESALGALGFETLVLESAAADRATYLRRPDLGRRLSERSAALLSAEAARPESAATSGLEPTAAPASAAADATAADPAAADAAAAPIRILSIVVGDGLSARAVHAHAAPLLAALRPRLQVDGWALAPVALVRQCRVALGDEVGAHLGAQAVLVLIGERPGLSSPDSLGAYLTWAPLPGRADAERNCVSNIRPEGLTVEDAARKLAWLLDAARRLGATGIALKDGSDRVLLEQAAPLHRLG